MDKKKCAVKFLSLSFPFLSFFLFFFPLPRNDTMPVNPYKIFPVWQQAVRLSFTFVLKTACLGKTCSNFTLQSDHRAHGNRGQNSEETEHCHATLSLEVLS